MTKEKTILAGITNDNELYFINLEIREDGEFSMTGDTHEPITRSDAVERTRERIEDDDDLWKMAVQSGNTRLGFDDWAQDILDSDELDGFDNSIFDIEVEVDGEDYLFESRSCGQHEEDSLKHYFIPEVQYKAIMGAWKQYHLKKLPKSTIGRLVIDQAFEVEQDIEALAIEAVKIINEDK